MKLRNMLVNNFLGIHRGGTFILLLRDFSCLTGGAVRREIYAGFPVSLQANR